MSYCRWSSMGGQCDLYIYADVSGGVTIHVATRRQVLTPDIPEDPIQDLFSGKITSEEWQDRHAARQRALEACPLEPIGLSRDGQSFNLDFAEAADLVADLRQEGYMVPTGVEEDIREDGLHPEEA